MERDYDDENIARINLISTHTLTWSVTPSLALRVCSTNNFNSHAHVERDDESRKIETKRPNFNSHAHVERDILLRGYLSSVSNFNSHAHVERDSHP